MNHEDLDRILNRVEEVFLAIAKDYKLNQATIERWRWDEPVVTLTWIDHDQISRNINALIIQDEFPRYKLLVEGNAWKDIDEEKGKVRVRRWQHHEINAVAENQVEDTIHAVYSKIITWGIDELKRKEHLTPQMAEL